MTAPLVDDLTLRHRADVEFLVDLALLDLNRQWTPSGRPQAVRDELAAILPGLTEAYGPAAATLGADWYDEMREAAAAPGRFRSIPAALPGQGRLDALVGWATQPLFVDEPNVALAQSNVEASFQRLIANMDRDTVRGSLARDPHAKGWSRQTTGKSCDFCVMLAGRGAVYSARTADFSAHDRCHCVAVPVFAGDPRPVQPYAPSQRQRSGRSKAKDPKSMITDFDATRSVAQLRDTLRSLERSLERFDSPGTRARIEELRRKIAART